jgi:hypothetical protein
MNYYFQGLAHIVLLVKIETTAIRRISKGHMCGFSQDAVVEYIECTTTMNFEHLLASPVPEFRTIHKAPRERISCIWRRLKIQYLDPHVAEGSVQYVNIAI